MNPKKIKEWILSLHREPDQSAPMLAKKSKVTPATVRNYMEVLEELEIVDSSTYIECKDGRSYRTYRLSIPFKKFLRGTELV